MSPSKHVLGAICTAADRGTLIGGPPFERKHAQCRRGIAELPSPAGLDGLPDERSNWTPMRTRILFHLTKSR